MGMFTKQVGLLTLVAAMGLAGCASTQQIDKIRAEAKEANANASKAADDAAAARAQAADALRTANAAKAEAAEAQEMARDAKRSADNTESKIDRMFKKAMHK
jgi:outer membrane murein-binding lipoprotein Lpp